MKLIFTRVLTVLTLAILLYSSCKKAAPPPVAATTTTDFKALSGQIAATLYQSITGQHGGANVSKGLTAPSNIPVSGYKALASNSVNTLCGFIIDTTYNYTVGTNPFIDTVKSFFGNFHFINNCDANHVDGYTVHDSLRTVLRYQLYQQDTYQVSQNYIVKALDNTYKLVSMDGSIGTLVDRENAESLVSTSAASYYSLSGLRVNFASGAADITAGAATFHTQIIHQEIFSYIYQKVDYYGTIEYLGNHMAKLTINPGHVYMVNLITGVVTPV